MKISIIILILSVLTLSNLGFGQSIITDIDGNQYKTVIIDEKEWMASNLNVRHYNNGDPIKHAKTVEEWKDCVEKKIGCWCYYANDSTNSGAIRSNAVQEPNSFGKLYNWYALMDPRGIVIEGFRIPDNDDWNSLIKYGSKQLKSKTGWQILGENVYWDGCDCKGYDCNGNDSLGFNVKGSGYRSYIGLYDDFAAFYEGYDRAVFWSSFHIPDKTREVEVSGEKITIEVGASIFGIDAFEGDKYFWEANESANATKGDAFSIRFIKE